MDMRYKVTLLKDIGSVSEYREVFIIGHNFNDICEQACNICKSYEVIYNVQFISYE